MTPSVSIVVPTYNRAAMLEQCLDSALEQDYERFEVIVIDDGSTDETPEILAAYAERFPPQRLRCERQENAGQAQAINRGYELATGEILGTLSSDDWLLPGAIRRQVQALVADPRADVVSGAVYLADEHGTITDTLIPTIDTFKTMVRNQELNISVGALMRRSLYERIGGWDPAYRVSPDFEYFLRAGPSLKHIIVEDVVGVYRSHSQQVSQLDTGLRTARERLRLLDSLFDNPQTAADLEDVRLDAYANLFAFAHSTTLGPRLNARDQRWLVLDTLPLGRSRSAQRQERLQLPRRRFQLDVLTRQLQLHIDTIRDLEELSKVQAQTIEHLEAALADRAASSLEHPEPAEAPGPPSRPAWWGLARRLTPSPLRHALGVLAHRTILPRVNGGARR